MTSSRSTVPGWEKPLRKGRGPSPAKTAATRQALATAGLAAFMDHGFAGTRMSDVAARAGVAKGTAYLHFEDKASLFAEVLRRFVLDAAGGRRIGRPRPGEATYAFLRRTLVPIARDVQASDGFRVLYLVIAEGTRFPELADIYRTVAIDPVLRLVRVYAMRAEVRGELRPDTITRLPVLLVAPMVLGAVWNNLFGRGDPLDVAAMLDSYLGLILTSGGSARDAHQRPANESNGRADTPQATPHRRTPKEQCSLTHKPPFVAD